MNIVDKIQETYKDKIQELQTKIDALNCEFSKALEASKTLPPEIIALDDCNYVWTWIYKDEVNLHVDFKSSESIKALKMLGIQGFKTSFIGGYFCDPNDWRWSSGKLVIDKNTFEFSGGKAYKPPQCTIEEYTEPAKPAAKRLKAICNETGKEV